MVGGRDSGSWKNPNNSHKKTKKEKEAKSPQLKRQSRNQPEKMQVMSQSRKFPPGMSEVDPEEIKTGRKCGLPR